jgi:hypothetical protein
MPARQVASVRESAESDETPPVLSLRDVQNRLSGGRQLLALDPAEWAMRLDEATATEMQVLITDLRQWCERMETALGYALQQA